MRPTDLARTVLRAIERTTGKKAPWTAFPTGDGQIEIAVWNTDGPAAESKRFDFRDGLTDALIGDVYGWLSPMLG